MRAGAVIPDARNARDRESRANPAFLGQLWIPGQAFGLPGMMGWTAPPQRHLKCQDVV
ncbi:MAG: IS110 family transposase, partial [Alphaproteobacteria bacterium]|nr:IS110 family transposase [Alphaproteobacteria bacterium]